ADARPDILAALGIVSGRSQHGVGMRALDFCAKIVKLLNSDTEPARITPDFIQRNEAVEAIEDRILHALGHGGSGELLEPHDKLCFHGSAHSKQQQIAYEIEQIWIKVGAVRLRHFRSFIDVALVVPGKLIALGDNISPVDREAGY